MFLKRVSSNNATTGKRSSTRLYSGINVYTLISFSSARWRWSDARTFETRRDQSEGVSSGGWLYHSRIPRQNKHVASPCIGLFSAPKADNNNLPSRVDMSGRRPLRIAIFWNPGRGFRIHMGFIFLLLLSSIGERIELKFSLKVALEPRLANKLHSRIRSVVGFHD